METVYLFFAEGTEEVEALTVVDILRRAGIETRTKTYVYSVLTTYMPVSQKWASDPITDGHEPPCGFWELNSGPLEEQSVLLTTEPSLQPKLQVFMLCGPLSWSSQWGVRVMCSRSGTWAEYWLHACCSQF